MKNRTNIIILIFFSVLITVPYLMGVLVSNDDFIFSGLILNPIDGYSYLAKMNQGYQGNWLFHLPFTDEPGQPVFLFFFYILLGHISRIFHLSTILVYHIARISGAIFLFLQVWKVTDKYVNLKHISKSWSLVFIIFASGVGWVSLLAGYESGDFVIPEAYPFYSSLINPHFAWGIGLFLMILALFFNENGNTFIRLVLSSVGLAIIMPFGSVILCVIISVFWILQGMEDKKRFLKPVLAICIPATMIVVFQFYETINHEQLAVWNQQNITPTPPVWDILISFSPMIFFGLYSFRNFRQNRSDQWKTMMFVWFVVCLGMIFIPFSFQRRFMFALAIPITILGLYGLDDVLSKAKKPARYKLITLILPGITIILLMVISFFTILGQASYSYKSAGENDLYQWIKGNTKDEVILASPEIAVKLPAYTGKRVYYGHPYETVDAAQKLENVENWYSCMEGEPNIEENLIDANIDLVILGKSSYTGSCFTKLSIIYENDEFILIRVN